MSKKKRYLFFFYFLISYLEANIWNVNTNGTWETGSNWTTGIVPNSSTLTVTFGNAISADRTVSINTSNEVQRLVFDSPFSYTLASTGGSLTVGDRITFTSGSHTIATDMTFGPTMTINQNSTQSSFFTGDITGTSLTIQGSNRLIESVFSGSINISTLSINNSTVRLNPGSSISNIPISCNNAGTLATTGNRTLPNNIIMQGGVTNLSSSLGNTLTLTGIISDTPTSTVLIFRNPGTINIPGANTLTTQTTIRDDALVIIGNDLALGTERIRLRENGTLSNTDNRTLTNTIQIFNDGAINASAGTDITLTGVIFGPGLLTLNGSGRKILSGNSTNTGGVALTEGITAMGSNTAFGTATVLLNGGALSTVGDRTFSNTVSVESDSFISPSASTTLTIDSVLAGTGGLTFNGNGTTVLNQANTYAGTTTISAGVVRPSSDTSFGTNSLSLNGGTLNVISTGMFDIERTISNPISLDANSFINTDASIDLVLDGVISGAADLTFNGTGTTALTGTNIYTGNTSIASGTVSLPNNNTNAAFGTGNVSFDGGDLTVGLNATINNDITLNATPQISGTAGGNTLTLTGVISGSNGINFTGNGVKRLEGANTYTGTTNVTGGAIVAVDDAAFGTGPLVLTTTLLTNINNRTINNPITANANTSILAGGGTTFTLDGTISGSNQITFNGTGTAILTQANPHSGTMRINAGIVGATNNLGFGTSTILLNGGTLGGPDNNTLNNPITVQADSFVNAFDMQTLTLTGVISGNNSLTFNGLGTTVLNQTNTYTGNTILSSGVTVASNDTSFGTSNISLNGGSLTHTGNRTLDNNISIDANSSINAPTSTTLNLNGFISGSSDVNFNGLGTVVLSQANSHTGNTVISQGTVIVNNDDAFGTSNISLNGGTLNNGNTNPFLDNTISIDNNSSIDTDTSTILTLNGTISGSSNITFTGLGTTVLNQANTYTGATIISAGTVAVNDDNAFGTSAVSLNGGSFSNASDRSIGNTISLDANSSIDPIASTTLTLNGIISGSNDLTFNGPGITALTGANIYTGNTSIASGTVSLPTNNTNSAFGTGNISFDGGDLTVGLNATINNDITLNATPQISGTAGGNTLTLTGVISGSNGINFTGNGVKRLEGANTYAGTTNVTGGAIVAVDDAAFGTGPLVLTTTLLTNINNRTINNPITANANTSILAGGGTTFTLDGTISGSNQITFNGTGTAILTQANPHSGTMRINAGIVGATNNLGFGTSTILLNGGTLGGPDNNTLNNPITVQANSFVNAFDMQTLTLTGVISGSNSLTFNGLGTTVLNQTNTYTGNTILSSGVTVASNDASFGTSNISLNGGSLTHVGNRTLDNNISIDANSSINPATSTTLNLNGFISGSSDLNFNGLGTVILSQANSHTGNTTLSSGIIIPADDDAFGTSNVSLNGGTLNNGNTNRSLDNTISIDSDSSINTDASTTLTLNGVISGSSNITFTGTGTTVLNQPNTYDGATIISAGTVAVNDDNAFGTSAVSLNGGNFSNASDRTIGNTISIDANSSIDPIASTTLTLNGVISGSNNLSFNGPGTVVLNEANTYTGATLLNGGITSIGNNAAFGTSNISLNGGTLANTADHTISNSLSLDTNSSIDPIASTTLTLNGVISGNNNLSFNGPGTTVLNQANTYTGATILNGGITSVSNDTAFGTSNISLNGGALANIGDRTLSNSLSLDTDSSITPTASTTLTLNGVISGNNDLTFNGTGTTVLNQTNTYTGATTLVSGTTSAANDAAFGVNSISLNGGALANIGDRTLANAIAIDTNSSIDPTPGTTLTLNGVISGNNDLTFNGNGTTVLTQANTYTGATTLSSGITTAANDASFGTTDISLNGGTLTNNANRTLDNNISIDVNSSINPATSTTLNLNGFVSGSSNLNFNGLGTVILSQANSHTGNTTLSSGIIIPADDDAFGTSNVSLNGGTLNNGNTNRSLDNTISIDSNSSINTDASTTLTLNGVISGSSNITFTGTGTTVLNQPNTYDGATIISAGTVAVNDDNAFGTSAVSLNGGNFSNASDRTIGNTISIDANSSIDPIASTTLTLNGVISGSNDLSFNGPGTVVLNEANTYTGATLLNGGITSIGNNAAFGTSNISLNGGALTNIGDRTLTNSISLDTASSIDPTASTTLTLNGVISGNNDLTFSGSGTTVLNQANTYVGATTLVSGTTSAANDQAFGTNSISLNGGALANIGDRTLSNNFSLDTNSSITPTASTTLTLSGVISGNNDLTFNGTGTTVLNQANTYTGATTLLSGTTSVGNDNAFGTNNISLNGGILANIGDRTIGNTVSVNANSSINPPISTRLTLSGVISGNNDLTFNGAGTIILTEANTHTGETIITSGITTAANNAAFGTGNISFNGGILENIGNRSLTNTISLDSHGLINPAASTTLGLNGIISGSNGLTFNGAGTASITQPNTYTGTTTLSAGTIIVGNDMAFGTSAVSLNGAILTNNTNHTLANTFSLEQNSSINPIGSTTLTLNGVISGSNNLTFDGPGTTILNQANTYTGETIVSSGTVGIGNDAAFGATNISLNGGALTNIGDRTLSNTISVNTNSSITTVASTILTLNGVISGSNDLNFNGPGITAVNGENTYTGNTNVTQGNVSINNNTTAFGSGIISFSGGNLTALDATLHNNIVLDATPTMEVLGVGRTLTLNGTISGNNGIDFEGPGTKTVTGTNTYTGTTSVSAGVIIVGNDAAFGTGSLVLNNTVLENSGNRTLSNPVTIDSTSTITTQPGTTFALDGLVSGTSGVTLNGSGTTIFNEANTYTGTTTVSSGTAVAGNDNAFGNTNISLNGGNLSANANRTLSNTVSLDADSAITPGTSSTLTLDGVISGANNLEFNGTGITILTQANTYAGATTLSSGITRAANDACFGTGPLSFNGGTLANVGNHTLSNDMSLDANSVVTTAASTIFTLEGIISGANSLEFNGPGTTVVENPNNYSGATTISAGTVVIGDDGSFGTSTISLNGGNLASNADHTVANDFSLDSSGAINPIASTTLTLNGIISGTGNLTLNGAGTTVLTQSNTYTGSTTISSGTVVADNDSCFGNADITLNGGNLTNSITNRTLNNNIFVQSPSFITPNPGTDFTLTGSITGAAAINVNPGGNLIITNSNTGTGPILLQNDNCSINNDNAFGTSTVTFDGASLTVASAVSLNNEIILNQNTVVEPISEDLNLSGTISGAGSLSIAGTTGATQKVSLTGNNTYTGGSTFTDVECDIMDDTNLGTGSVTLNSSILNIQTTLTTNKDITLNTTTPGSESGFIINENDVFTATSNITSSDGFIKNGEGDFVLFNDQPGVTGTVCVMQGTLFVEGSLANANLEAVGTSTIRGSGNAGAMVINDGTLKGNGTYTDVTLNIGMVAPGDSIGTITVTGNYIQNAGTIYEVELDTNASDQIIVTGDAIIQTGAILTVLDPIGTILEGATYDILIANNINQLWSVVNLPENIELTLSLVDGNTIARLSAPTSISFNNEEVDSGNPRIIANYINAIEITRNPDLEALVMSIESDNTHISDALNQLHHARFASLELINVESNYGIISTIARQESSLQGTKRCAKNRHSLWVGALGTVASREQKQELRGSKNKDVGGILGYDYSLSPNIALGIAGGYLQTDLKWDKLGGKAHCEKGFAALYMSFEQKRIEAVICLMGGANFYDINRRIAFTNIDRTAKSENTGGFCTSNLDIKLDLLGTTTTLIAQGNIDYNYFYQGSFKETGANSVNLLIDPRTSHFLRSQLGLQVSRKLEVNSNSFRYYVGGNWVNKTLLNNDNFSAKFLSFRSETPFFTVQVSKDPTNGFLAEAGFVMSTNRTQISLAYQGEFYRKNRKHDVQGSWNIRF